MMTLGQLTKVIRTIEGSTTLAEGQWLYQRTRDLPEQEQVVVEIGSFLGKSTICLAAGVSQSSGAKIYAIDPHQGDAVIEHKFSGPTYKKFLTNVTKSGLRQIVVPIRKTSRQAAKLWKRPIGLLFIDGDHAYGGVKHDLIKFGKYLRSEGALVVHDALNPGAGLVKALVEEMFNKFKYSAFGVVGSMLYAIKKRPSKAEWINWYCFKLMFKLIYALLSWEGLPKRWKRGIEQYIVKRWLKQLLNWISL